MNANYLAAVTHYYYGYGKKLAHNKRKEENIDEAIGRSSLSHYYHSVNYYWYPQKGNQKIEGEIKELMRKGMSRKRAVHLLASKYPYIRARNVR